MLIAQITDTHFLTNNQKLAGKFDTGSAFEHLIESLAKLTVKPDLILYTGDLGEDATHEEYAHIARELRALNIPVRAVPGNHDKRAPMIDELPDMVSVTKDGHLCCVDTSFDLAIIGLDTIVEGKPHGALCAKRLAWLKQTLTDLKGIPALIFMHHPPITTGLRAMDDIGLLEGGAEFKAMIEEHGKIEAILCGHLHRSIQGTFAGVPVRVSPSASHQIECDLRVDQPYKLVAEPAQYMLHIWNPENGVTSHTVPVKHPV
ncbi:MULTISPECIES: phosphodiesterase [Thalassospira]|uniref:Phosphodiesterase n=1 Tax=Thalassospira aquimaris TaxID=3037796 RepID=A0ABT6GAC3_9PROT|nr:MULTISPECIES: phosphodiesterase [Thalassospira]MDG4719020.1 phosphodiesterase [Thalassospira sp. FZY0004]